MVIIWVIYFIYYFKKKKLLFFLITNQIINANDTSVLVRFIFKKKNIGNKYSDTHPVDEDKATIIK